MEQEFKNFVRKRTDEKKKYYFGLCKKAIILLLVSFLVNIIGGVLDQVGHRTTVIFYILNCSFVLAAFIRVFGIILYSVLPVKEVDGVNTVILVHTEIR